MQLYAEVTSKIKKSTNTLHILLESNFGRKWIFCFFPLKFNLPHYLYFLFVLIN